MRELESLRGSGRGQTVVFIGNGPSIRPYDLSRIRHRTFASNYFVPFGLTRWGLTLDFYLCNDPRVFFIPWERYQVQRGLVPPGGDLLRAPSPADYIAERELYLKTKVILPASLDWYDFAHPLFEGADTAALGAWLPRQAAAGGAEGLFVYHVRPPAARFSAEGLRRRLRRRLLYRGRFKAHGFDPRGYTYTVPRWLDGFLPPLAPSALAPPADGRFGVPVWAVNSFCNVVLPALFLLGFDTIVLLGVDYDKEGYFFNPYRSPHDRFFYREEFDELYYLFRLARSLPHAPKIKIVRTGTNHITPPDGFVDFEEICA